MNIREIKGHIDEAYQWISKIPVSGDAVDAVAVARQELRTAFKLLEQEKEVKDDG